MICSGGAGRYSTPSPNYSRTDVQALVYLITSRDEKKTFKQSEIEPMVSMPETFSRFNVNVTQKIMASLEDLDSRSKISGSSQI